MLIDFIADVFSISGRGTVATGRVERGVITKGSDVEVIGLGANFKTTLTGVEMFRKELDRGEAGDNMGALLRGVKREQLRRGMVLIAPGSMKAVQKFQAQIYVINFIQWLVVIPVLTPVSLDPHEGGGWPIHSFHGKLSPSSLPAHS